MYMGVALWANQMGKNLGAIGNILGIASRNILGTHWEQGKNTDKSMSPLPPPRKTPKGTT
jgi:hypothetical protein